jgi:CubicO group peptidase (beta-lactamase class C family)
MRSRWPAIASSPTGEVDAHAIHWSGKTGNASVYTTLHDGARWVDTLFGGHFVSPASREDVLDTSMRVGYGWFKGDIKRLGETAYYMNGRAPGFSSFVLHLPNAQTTVILLSNIYSSATTPMGYDIAALMLGLPYEELRFSDPLLPRQNSERVAARFSLALSFTSQMRN